MKTAFTSLLARLDKPDKLDKPAESAQLHSPPPWSHLPLDGMLIHEK